VKRIDEKQEATFRKARATYTRWMHGSFGSQQYEVQDWGWQITTPAGDVMPPMTKRDARAYARKKGWQVRIESSGR